MKISFTTYLKTAAGIVLIGILVFLFFIGLESYHRFKSWVDTGEQREQIRLETDKKLLQIASNQVRAETIIVPENSDQWERLEKLLKEQYPAIMELMKKNNEEVKNYGSIVASVDQNMSLVLKSQADHTYKAGTDDPNAQEFKKIMLTGRDESGKELSIASGWAIRYLNTGNWKTGMYPLEFNADIIQSEQKDGQYNTYVVAWAENKQDDESLGIKVPLNLKATFKQVKKTTKEFYWWSPHVSLNLDGSLNNAGGGISVSFSGYGRTRNDLSWRFLDVGLSTDKEDSWVKFSPVTYNIGENLPFVNNTFLGPFVGYDFEKYFFGVGLSVPF